MQFWASVVFFFVCLFLELSGKYETKLYSVFLESHFDTSHPDIERLQNLEKEREIENLARKLDIQKNTLFMEFNSMASEEFVEICIYGEILRGIDFQSDTVSVSSFFHFFIYFFVELALLYV